MKKGFSLIELLVVIAIVGILSRIAFSAAGGNLKKARDTQRKADLAEIKKAMISAKNDCSASAYFPSVNPVDSKTDFDTLSTNLYSAKYIKAKIQDLKATSPIATSPIAYEFFPLITDTYNNTVNVASVCPSITGTYGSPAFLLRALLENTSDPDAIKSFSNCSGFNGVSGSVNDGYFYICVK